MDAHGNVLMGILERTSDIALARWLKTHRIVWSMVSKIQGSKRNALGADPRDLGDIAERTADWFVPGSKRTALEADPTDLGGTAERTADWFVPVGATLGQNEDWPMRSVYTHSWTISIQDLSKAIGTLHSSPRAQSNRPVLAVLRSAFDDASLLCFDVVTVL